MRARTMALVAACLLGLGSTGALLGQETPTKAEGTVAPERFTRDAVCGPRCVQYLLKHHNGEAPELISLVRQIQWPKVSDGSSFGDLQRALESFGIQAKPLQIPDGCVPVLAHPCICHFRARGESMGHFVVLLPGTTRSVAIIWDNGHVSECPSWELAEQVSGAYLLTAPRGEAEPSGASVWTTDAIVERASYYGIVLMFTLAGTWLLFESLSVRHSRRPITNRVSNP
jgi:ABC-type bacteriocin/lantibiotic exporter with double-glycine peptidase domain